MFLYSQDRKGLHTGYKFIDIFIGLDGKQQQKDNQFRGKTVEKQPMREMEGGNDDLEYDLEYEDSYNIEYNW